MWPLTAFPCTRRSLVSHSTRHASTWLKTTRASFLAALMAQSNKVKALLEAVPNLALLETVDSAKLASKLDSSGGQPRAGLCWGDQPETAAPSRPLLRWPLFPRTLPLF